VDQRGFPVLDSFRGHLTEAVSRSLGAANATVVVIPGGCTGKVQPVDVSLNKPIKDTVRGQWEEFMMHKATAEQGPSNLECATKTDITDWIVQANCLLSSQGNCIEKAFKVCGITNSLLIRCATELPEFRIPYGSTNPEDVEDIFEDTDHSDSDCENESNSSDASDETD
jgi:hypothetical protein